MIHQKRREELLSMLGHDAVVIVSTNSEQKRNSDVSYPFRPDSNFWYLTGFTEPDAIAVFSKENYAMFLRPKDEAKEIWNGIRLGVELAPETLLTDQAYDIGTFFDNIDSLIKKGSVIYYDAPGSDGWKDNSSTNIHNQRINSLFERELKPLNPYISEMRLIKDKDEVKNMQDAANLASEAHMNAMKAAIPGLYEHNIASGFDSHFRNCNSEHSYPPIVASGENACILHYTENNQELKDGDLLLIDAGCEINGYASDITRTFPVNGKFSEAQKEIYDVVLNAQKSAINSIKPGVSSNKPHETACEIITNGLIKLGIMKSAEDLTKFYMHNTGHWLGLDVHDVGSKLINDEFREFKNGMVTTVEPGIYIRRDDKIDSKYWGIGIRIEDDVLVTETGNHVLSEKAIKDIDEIEHLMGQR
ncbi:MAG: M24 family metallopeptidase [Thiotrichales bacterium]|jgi:Xaa-Pro aminopeptidase|nr:M24 family metallopeptidase [Thiotrichales bacterium]MBT5500420.1 M24 family metallopeptidase [Thiotrichales bacterium]MBT5983983.1 M24 family metallopeptidase [Thiotrichales bacterium]